MSHLLRKLASLLACLAMLAPVAVSSTNNDAGSGKDAPGHENQAWALPGYGSYTGYLTDHDRDSYRLDQTHSGATCVEANIASGATGNANLTVFSADATRGIFANFGPTQGGRLAIAAPEISYTSYRLHNHDPIDAGTYDFSISRLSSAGVSSDTGTDGDASTLLAQAAPIRPGCVGGSLSATDLRDVYSFSGTAGSTAVVSFAHDSGEQLAFQLLDPDGNVLASVANSGVAVVELPSDGTYYLSASTPTTTSMTMSSSFDVSNYVGGISIGPPGGDPCRPSCLM